RLAASLRGRRGTRRLLVLDAAHHALREAGPVGRRRREVAPQQTAQAAQRVGLALATRAGREMGRRRARRLRVQGLVEVGPDPTSVPIAGQHVGWTVRPPLAILTTG